MPTKVCFKCNKSLPLDSFYPHGQMADGYLGKCKDCTKKDVSANRAKRIDAFREYDRARYRTMPHRQQQLASLVKARPEMHVKANRILSNAIRCRRVIRAEACWHCGSTERIEGHHVDYSRPLDVIWLCRSCHCKAHRQTTLSERQAA